MKANRSICWTPICAAVLAATTVFRSSADQATLAVQPERSYTGTIVTVDPKEHTLETKGLVLSRKFNLGDTCTYVVLDKDPGAVGDLRPGEKVTVSYQDAHGVLIADRVVQEPMRYEGMVTMIDPATHMLKLHRPGSDKHLQIADDCKIVLRDEKTGTFTDIHPGNHVTVTYETPAGKPVAREIAQTSLEYAGTLTAIDLGDRTLKARAVFETKKFNVADNCAIVINGKTDGQLSDLKPNDRLVLNYDEINGVNVVNRIAPVEAQTNSAAATPMAGD
jgi:hypothetical protein